MGTFCPIFYAWSADLKLILTAAFWSTGARWQIVKLWQSEIKPSHLSKPVKVPLQHLSHTWWHSKTIPIYLVVFNREKVQLPWLNPPCAFDIRLILRKSSLRWLHRRRFAASVKHLRPNHKFTLLIPRQDMTAGQRGGGSELTSAAVKHLSALENSHNSISFPASVVFKWFRTHQGTTGFKADLQNP